MIKTFHINSSFINKLSVRRALLLDSLPESLLAKFQFLWTGEYSGNNLLSDLGSDVITVTGKDWSTKYIPPNTTATFSVPNNATYISADGTDDFWFNSSDVLQQKNHADLIASTTMRTFIKYSDFDPYKVYAIGILKSGETLTSSEENIISKFFKLWLFYFGTYSDYGYLKDNRTLEGDIPYWDQQWYGVQIDENNSSPDVTRIGSIMTEHEDAVGRRQGEF